MKKQTYKWIETWIFTLTMNVFAFTFAHGYFHEFGMLGLQPFLGMHILLVCRCQSCRPKAVAERFCRAAMWSGWRGRCFHSTGSKHGVSWWHVLNIARPNCLPSNRLRSLRRCSTFTLDFKTSRFVGCSQVLGSVWLSLAFSGMWPVFATSWVRRSPCEHVARCALRTRAFQCPTRALNFHVHGRQVFWLRDERMNGYSMLFRMEMYKEHRVTKAKFIFGCLRAGCSTFNKKTYFLTFPSYLIISWRNENIWTASKIVQASNWSLMDTCQWLLQPNLDSQKSRSMMTWGAFARMSEGVFLFYGWISMRIFRGLGKLYCNILNIHLMQMANYDDLTQPQAAIILTPSVWASDFRKHLSEEVLPSAASDFEKTAEDGGIFRIYKIGSLEAGSLNQLQSQPVKIWVLY